MHVNTLYEGLYSHMHTYVYICLCSVCDSVLTSLMVEFTREELEAGLRPIFTLIWEQPEAYPFHEPVNPQRLGIPVSAFHCSVSYCMLYVCSHSPLSTRTTSILSSTPWTWALLTGN